jgi:hypothetical protein
MARSRKRPPKLEPTPPPAPRPPEPVTVETELRRGRVVGRASGLGASELRRIVHRIVEGDRRVLGGLSPFPLLTDEDVWSALVAAFGTDRAEPGIDAVCCTTAARRATARIASVSAGGGRVAFATARPASLLPLHTAFARLARAAGADVLDGDDSTPLRIDGRAGRRVRWIDGVACATDGGSLLAVQGAEAPDEWLFLLPRPALAVADGPFAEAALEAGIEVVALAGFDRPALAVAAARREPVWLVPLHVGRPAGAYAPLVRVLEEAARQALEVAPAGPEIPDAGPPAPRPEAPAVADATDLSPASGVALDNRGDRA